MQVAYVHDWLVTYRGGEKVLAALLELYPEAPVFTLFYDAKAMPKAITERDIRVPWPTRYLQRGRKLLLPVLPSLIEGLPLSGYDLIISTSSCVAKGVRKHRGAKHICYLHSPMRYIWDQQNEYLAGVAHIPLARAAIKAWTPMLRRWDVASASRDRVDVFVANSSFVAERAQAYYGREAEVLHPPIELERFSALADKSKPRYLLAAGALVSYKRFDLAIAAAALTRIPLIIAGSGPMEAALRRQADETKADVSFVISPSDEKFQQLLQGAAALLFPGVEDFGMVAIEAMASGTPVIAYRGGGARDFITPKVTGLFFEAASPESLAQAIGQLDTVAFAPEALAAYAQGYNKQAFLQRMRHIIATTLAGATP